MKMKSSLIALAVAGAFVSSAAMAEATIYGVMHGSVDMKNDGKATAAKTNEANNRQSRLGFKGTDDLGSGLSAIWQIEGGISPDAGTGALANRNTFLGLKSDSMGTVLAGNYDTPYKSSTRNLDVFADTAADNRADTNEGGTGMGAGHDVRLSNVLAYVSPTMSGLSVAAATVFGAEGATATSKKGSALSLAVMYSMDQIYATVAYQTLKYGAAGQPTSSLAAPAGKAADDKDNAFKVGGGFSTDVFAVNAVYENLTSKVALTGVDTKSTNIYLAGKFNVSSTDAAKLSYATIGDSKDGGVVNTPKDGAKQIAVGYDHGMSKNTTVYALYTKTTLNAAAPNNDAPTDISIGMKVAF